MGLRMKTLIFCVFTEKSDFSWRNSRKTNIEGELPKKGWLGKKEGVVFLRTGGWGGGG